MLVFNSLALAQEVAIFSTSLCLLANFGVDRVDSNQQNSVPAVYATVPKPSTLLDYFELPSDLSPDMKAWGDSINEDPKDLHRIYFQNIGSIRNEVDEMDRYVSIMAQFKINTFCWADHDSLLNMSQVTIQQAIQRPLLAHFRMAQSLCSNSQLPPGPPPYVADTNQVKHSQPQPENG